MVDLIQIGMSRAAPYLTSELTVEVVDTNTEVLSENWIFGWTFADAAWIILVPHGVRVSRRGNCPAVCAQ
jgi:hypothetical protein